MTTSVGVADAVEWAHVLCGCHIQNDWARRAMNLHHILHWAWTFLHRNYSDDSEVCSYGQLVIGNFITTMSPLTQRFFCETSSHPGDLAPYSPDLVPWDFWLFPKLKSPLKGKRFQTVSEIQKNSTGQLANGDRENCVRSQGSYPEGDWDVIVLCTVFLVSRIFFNKSLYFS